MNYIISVPRALINIKLDFQTSQVTTHVNRLINLNL